MNVKYAIILASGLSSTVAVMSQAAPLTNGDIDSPSQDAISAYGRIEGVGRL